MNATSPTFHIQPLLKAAFNASLVFISISLLIISSATFANTKHTRSSVWKVSSTTNNHYFYLGGTVHLLKAEDHPLPAVYDIAYADAHTLVFETNMDSAKTVEFQRKFMQALSLPAGTTLEQSISAKTYQALSEFLKTRGIDIQQFTAFTPAGVGIMIALMEYQRMGFLPQLGVDTTYDTRAKKDNKPRAELETVDQQIQFIANMANGREDQMIEYTLRDLAILPEYFKNVKDAWRSGNLKKLEQEGLRDMRQEFPEMYNTILVERNNNWMPQLQAMLTTPNTEFVLVGALHLVGKEGLIKQLQKQGYKIEQLKYTP